MLDNVTLDSLRKQLGPKALGASTGTQNQPPLDARTDPSEHQIDAAIRHCAAQGKSRLMDQQRVAAQTRADLQRSNPIAAIKAEAAEARGRINNDAKEAVPDLRARYLESRNRQANLLTFKADNGITRAPHYPNLRTTSWMWGLVLILFVGESFTNANFLAGGSEGGVLGAYTVAFGFSLVNLSLPFLFFGPLSCYLGHVKTARKVLAGVIVALYALLFAPALNLLLAHYRDVSRDIEIFGNQIAAGRGALTRMWGAQFELPDAGRDALTQMRESPFGLQDAESWLLLFIGLLCAAIAFFDGRYRDDTYPGYGDVDRSRRSAERGYHTARHDALRGIGDIRDTALGRIKRIADDANKLPGELQKVAATGRQMIEEFDQDMDQLQSFGTALINEYRAANHTARSDDGVPACHDTAWQLTRPAIDRSTPVDASEIAEAKSRLPDVNMTRQEEVDLIQKHCEAVQTSLLQEVEAPVDPGAGVQRRAPGALADDNVIAGDAPPATPAT